jgi:hypothetical protein
MKKCWFAVALLVVSGCGARDKGVHPAAAGTSSAAVTTPDALQRPAATSPPDTGHNTGGRSDVSQVKLCVIGELLPKVVHTPSDTVVFTSLSESELRLLSPRFPAFHLRAGFSPLLSKGNRAIGAVSNQTAIYLAVRDVMVTNKYATAIAWCGALGGESAEVFELVLEKETEWQVKKTDIVVGDAFPAEMREKMQEAYERRRKAAEGPR